MPNAQNHANHTAQHPHTPVGSKSAQQGKATVEMVALTLVAGIVAVSATGCGGGGDKYDPNALTPIDSSTIASIKDANGNTLTISPNGDVVLPANLLTTPQTFTVTLDAPVPVAPTVQLTTAQGSDTALTPPPATGICTPTDATNLTFNCIITPDQNTLSFASAIPATSSVVSLASAPIHFRLLVPASAQVPLWQAAPKRTSSTMPYGTLHADTTVSNVAPVLPASAVTTANANLTSSAVIDLTPYMHKDWKVSVSGVNDPNGGSAIPGIGAPTATVQSGVITMKIPAFYGTANVSASAVLENAAGSSVPFNVTGNNFLN